MGLRHESELGCGGVDVVTRLQLLDFGDDAIDRCGYRRIREVESRPIEGGERLANGRATVYWRILIATQVSRGTGGLLNVGGQLLMCRVQVMFRLIQLRPRSNPVCRKLLLTLQLALLEGKRIASRFLVSQPLTVSRLESLDLQACTGKLSLRVLHCDLKGTGIQGEQNLPHPDKLVVMHPDFTYAPGNVAAHLHPGGLQIRIIGGHIAPARQVEREGEEGDQYRAADQEQPAMPSQPGVRRGGFCGLFGALRHEWRVLGRRDGPLILQRRGTVIMPHNPNRLFTRGT